MVSNTRASFIKDKGKTFIFFNPLIIIKSIISNFSVYISIFSIKPSIKNFIMRELTIEPLYFLLC